MRTRRVAGLLVAAFLSLLPLCAPRALAAAPSRDRDLAAYLDDRDASVSPMLHTPRDRVVLVYAGLGYTRIIAAAPLSVEPETLRAEMQSAVDAAGLTAAPIETARRAGYTRAQWTERHPHPFAGSGARALRYGAIAAPFRHGGEGALHMAVRFREAATREISAPELTSSTVSVWYDVRNAAPDATAHVSFRFDALRMLLAAGMLMGWVGGIGLTLFGLIMATRRARHPLVRAYYVRLAQIAAMCLFPVQVFAGGTLMNSGAGVMAVDLWFGEQSLLVPFVGGLVALGTAFGVLAAAQVILLFAAKADKWKDVPVPDRVRRGLKKEMTEMERKRREEEAAVDPRELALRRRLDTWRTIAKGAAFMLGLVLTTVVRGSGPKYLRHLDWLFVLLFVGAVDFVFKKWLAPYQKRTPDHELQREAQAAALRIGTSVHEAVIDDTWEGRTKMKASFHKGRFVLSRRAYDHLTPDEREYIVMKTIMEGNRRWKPEYAIAVMTALMIGSGVIGFAFVDAPFSRRHPMFFPALILGGTVFALAAFMLVTRLERKPAGQQARRLIELGAKPEVAATAIMKWTLDMVADGTPEELAKKIAKSAADKSRERLTLDAALRGPETKGGGFAERFKRR